MSPRLPDDTFVWRHDRWSADAFGVSPHDSLWMAGLGLIETFLADLPRPPLWAAHRDRLERGINRLKWPSAAIPSPPPHSPAVGRLVATIDTASAALVFRLHFRPLSPPPAVVRVRYSAFPVTGCLSPYPNLKTIDHGRLRGLAAAASSPDGAYDWLLANPYGQLTEGAWHNVFWEDRAGRLITPSKDTGCVDGVGRRWLLAQLTEMGHDCREVADGFPDPSHLRQVWLTNAVRGPVWVDYLENTAFGPPSPLFQEIRRRWAEAVAPACDT